MPKKRKTRAAPSRKAGPGVGEPTAEDGQQDKDDRAEAISVFKQDFEQELKLREKKLEKELKDLTKSMRAAHGRLLLSIPSFIQKMTVEEFVASGGSVDAAAQVTKAALENTDAAVVMPLQSVSSVSDEGGIAEPLSEATSRTGAMAPPPSMCAGGDTAMSLAMETPADTKKTRSKRKPNAFESTATATRTTRRTRQAAAAVDIGDTPALTAPTPAFDPRLPGLKKGNGRSRAKTRREATIVVDTTDESDFINHLGVLGDICQSQADKENVIAAYRNLHAKLGQVLGQ